MVYMCFYAVLLNFVINYSGTVGSYRGNGRVLCYGSSKRTRTIARKHLTQKQMEKMEAWRDHWCSCLDWRSIAGYYWG